MNERSSLKSVAIGEIVVAAGILLFWSAFFLVGIVDIADPRLREIYLAFESSFPAADIGLAAVLILGGRGLLRRRPSGELFSLLGGAALVFLGLLDVSFNSRQGIYGLGWDEALINGGINAVCLIFGTLLVAKVWSLRMRRA